MQLYVRLHCVGEFNVHVCFSGNIWNIYLYIYDSTYTLLVRTLVTAFSPHRSCAKERADSIWVIPYRDVSSTMIMPAFSLRP